MANPPDRRSKPPKKTKDPARPTRAKAAREALPPIAPALADLLNPAINRGEAGVGSQTGLSAPPSGLQPTRAPRRGTGPPVRFLRCARADAGPAAGAPRDGAADRRGHGRQQVADSPVAALRERRPS